MAGPIRIAILANGRQARSEAALTARAYGQMGRSVSRTAKLIGGFLAFRQLARGAAAVARVGSQYVSSLNKVQALTGATDRQMGKLATRLESQSSAYARFGQTTGDAATGLVELAKSGLSANKALAAIRGTMTLAKAGELEVADSSELVANTLNTFNLRASQAAKIANSLANAANISSANVTDVAESFKYVAPLAAKANVTVDQTNALLAELANSGIKASQAGTSLRKFLLSLQAPTGGAADWINELGVSVYNTAGKMRPIGSLIEQLRGGLSKLSQEDQNFALRTIFGLTGITGAQVILKGGVEGLKKYTKGVQRAGAATKLAASASKGLAGTWASMKASATSTTQELYRRFSPALDARLQSVASYLADNQDEMIATGIAAARRLGPALETLTGLAKSTAVALKDTAVPIAEDLLPAIEDLLKLAKSGADAVNELPGPVKEIGVQAVIAALVLPRLTAGITSVTSSVALNIARLQQWRAEMTYATTRAQQTAAMMQRLGAAARAAAGIGGLVLLTQSAGETNEGLKALERVGGGALLGFAVGGPIGAAIGGTAGAMSGLLQATKRAKVEARSSMRTWQDYASTLDEVTGATTRATRQMAIQALMESGALKRARELGLSRQQVISAALGETKAHKEVAAALEVRNRLADRLAERAEHPGGDVRQQYEDISRANAIRDATSAIEAEIGATAEANRQKTAEIALLRKIPRRLVTRFQTEGLPESVKEIRKLGERFKLTPRQVRTVFKMANLDLSRKQVKQFTADVGRNMRTIDKARPFGPAWLKGLSSSLGRGKQSASKNAKGIKDGIEGPIANTKPDLSRLIYGVRTGAKKAAETGSAGGKSVGNNLKAGILAGFAGTAAALAAQARAAVRAAVTAARQEGKIHSPSGEMRDKVGKPLAQGVVVGFIREAKRGASGIKSAIDKIQQLIASRLDGKKQAGRRKSLLKSLKDERAALLANGRAQDKNAKLLDKALDKYKALKQRADEFAASIKTGFQSYGSIVGLGTTGGGSAVTLPALLSQLQARATIAQQFATVISSLRRKLNKTSLRQLLEQASSGDLEGALASAQVIASGGPTVIAQINQLTAQITRAGADLGEKMRKKFFGHGLEIAEGVVDGLKRREKKLDRVAGRLAEKFVREAQAGLHIHASSGGNTADKIAARRTPALTASQSAGSASAAATTVRVKLTAEQVTQLQRGKEIQADLDVFRAAGGRSKVRSS